MSKAKKIISILLVIAMVLTVAPVSVVASAANPTYTYGAISTTKADFTVSTSATEVIRIASDPGAFTLGTAITSATPSGIPGGSSGTYMKIAYAGETATWPKVTFSITGASLDQTPTISADGATISFDNVIETVNGSTTTYEWYANGGTATDDNDVVYTITYKINNTEYKAYEFSHVENILVMNGYVFNKIRDRASSDGGKRRVSTIVQYQARDMYSQLCPDGSGGGSKGFINYATGTALSGNALLGCGSETTFSNEVSAYGVLADAGNEVKAALKTAENTSDSRINVAYGNNDNRGQPKIYIDKRNENLRTLNFRMTLQNGEKADFADLYLLGVHVLEGKVEGTSNNDVTASTTSTAQVSVNINAGPSGSNAITSTSTEFGNFGWVMAEFSGTGVDTIGGPYYKTFVADTHAAKDQGSQIWSEGYLTLEIYTYNTTDLYNLVQGIKRGTGSYTCTVNGSTVYTFNKGVNPQAAMYEANSWQAFLTKYQAACKILATPDTDQATINTRANELWAAYSALTGYNATVNYKVKHLDKNTGAEIIPAQTGSVAAGSIVTANAATIEGYEISGQSVKSPTFNGRNAEETIEFQYTAKNFNVFTYFLDDNNGSNVIPTKYGSQVDVDALEHGTKEHYTFDGWYYQNGNTNGGDWGTKATDFEMGSEAVVLYARWIPTPIKLSVSVIVDGQEIEFNDNFAQIIPNEAFARPADYQKEGYLFVEYYEDSALTTPVVWPLRYDVGTPDKTIYARMVNVDGKIVFESNGGSTVNDVPFTVGSAATPPADPTKQGYSFVGWFYDRELTQAVDWSAEMTSNTGFIAYAKWEAIDVFINFNLGTPETKFDTAEIPAIVGKAETEIQSKDYPPNPKKFGQLFEHWINSETGEIYEFTAGVKYDTKDITLEPVWRGTDYSAFIGIDAFEKLSGEYKQLNYDEATQTETREGTAQAGDIVTFRMTSLTNFYTGSSSFVFMYDHNFFELVDVDTAAFTLNKDNEYVAGINPKIQGVTTVATANWPKPMLQSASSYSAMLITIDPTVTVSDYNTEPMSDGQWLIEFQLKVKADATGSGRVFMDNGWTRTADNPVGKMFYGWSEKSVSVLETYNNVVTPDLTEAEVKITLDETPVEQSTVTVLSGAGAWESDVTSMTFTGPAETEIRGFVAPTRQGYDLGGWAKDNGDGTVDTSVTWAQGYYAKMDQNNFTFVAQWIPKKYTVNFYKDNDVDSDLHWTNAEAEYELAYATPAEVPTKLGYVFDGWVDINGNPAPATTPYEGIDLYPKWAAADVNYTINIVYTILATGSQGTTSATKTAKTDSIVKIVSEVPAVPEENTTYVTLAELPVVAQGNYIFDETANTLPIVSDSIAADGTTVITVNYIAKPVTFTFDANGGAFADGTTTKTEEGRYLATANGPGEDPTREGYDFKGWTGFVAGTTKMQKDTTYKANWTASKYPVVFDANGGYFDNDPTVTTKSTEVTFGTTITQLAAPVKEGHDFLGWATTATATATEPLGTMDSTDSAGKTFYAVYKLTDYTVTYFDGENTSTVTANMGDTLTVIAEPTKTGYTFSGWQKDGSPIEAGATFTMPAANVTIEGSFTANTYKVTFDATGGYFGEDTSALTQEVDTQYESTIAIPANPNRQGYEFLGWAEAEEGDRVTITTLTTAGDKTYYALWKALFANYTVETYYQDVTGAYPETADASETKQGTVAEEVSYSPSTSVTGFTLDSASVLTGVVKADGTLVLTVKYIRNKYSLSTDVDGTVTKVGDYYYESQVNAPASPTKEGWIFNGWSGVTFPLTITQNETATATWVRNKYMVTFYTDSTMTEKVAEGVEYEYEMAIQAPTATKEGHSFDKWIDAETGAEVNFAAGVNTPAKAVNYYATWTKNSYNIVYRAQGGKFDDGLTTKTVPVLFGTAKADIVEPEDPTREGYKFLGWTEVANGAIVELPDTMPATNLNRIAKWQVEQHTVTFDANGGTVIDPVLSTEGATYVVTDDFGTEIFAPADPTKTGYTFTGWDAEIPATIPAIDTIITAQWEINQYTITFANTGDTTIEPIKQDYNTAVTAPADPTKTGYTFAGWDVAVPTTMPAEDITITAQWTINQYTITFADTGDKAIEPIKQDYNTAVTAPADPTKTGYTFAGWDVAVPATMPAENITITAQWTINQYTITFANTGDTEIEPIKQDYNTAVTAPAQPTKVGYTWGGWDMEIPATMPAEDITITGSWTINQYTVTFDEDGGSDVEDIKQDYNSTVTLPAAPTKEGHKFNGWEKDGVVYQPGETFAMPVGGAAYTAKWDANTYKLTWVIDGVETENDVVYGTAITAPSNPTKTGYTWTGWDKAVPATMPAEDLVITATFDINQYTITFANTGDTVIEPIKQDYNTAVVAPAQPTKVGYTWGGWDKEIPATMPAEDITITGSWTINQYTVTFLDAEGGEFSTDKLDYEAAIVAPEGTPYKEFYEFKGWSLDGINVAEDLGTVPADDIEITPIYTKNKVTLKISDSSTAVVDTEIKETVNAEPTLVGYIYGLRTRLTENALRNEYLGVEGDGRLAVTMTKYKVCGTGTKVEVYDRNDTPDDLSDDILKETYYIVIFGDINGDSSVDATDYSMVNSEVLGATAWSNYDAENLESCAEYDHAKTLAADLNGDGYITTVDGSIIEGVSLYVYELDQQTGTATPYGA